MDMSEVNELSTTMCRIFNYKKKKMSLSYQWIKPYQKNAIKLKKKKQWEFIQIKQWKNTWTKKIKQIGNVWLWIYGD
jgi:hypothetical protein